VVRPTSPAHAPRLTDRSTALNTFAPSLPTHPPRPPRDLGQSRAISGDLGAAPRYEGEGEGEGEGFVFVEFSFPASLTPEGCSTASAHGSASHAERRDQRGGLLEGREPGGAWPISQPRRRRPGSLLDSRAGGRGELDPARTGSPPLSPQRPARSRRHPARSPRAQRAHCGLQPAARPRCSASLPAATRCRRQRRSPFPCARLACAQVSSGETVAIKRIAEVFYDAHEAKKVLREIRLLRDFRHPHTH